MKKIFKLIEALLILIALAVAASHLLNFQTAPMIYGVSFNNEYAHYLGLDPHAVLEKILGDWKFKHVRLMAQWKDIEPKAGQFELGDLDWQMDLAAARGAKVMLVIGQKTPRWPECHTPAWANALSDQEYFDNFKRYLTLVVNRYKSHVALESWQIENEPFLPFGDHCRAITPAQLQEEIALTRQLDGAAHAVMVTDSGELSTWSRTAHAGDLFGTTMYRVVWNKYTGYWSYDWLPPLFYRAKLWFNKVDPKNAYVAELQAEPWIPDNNLFDTALAEQYKSMNVDRLKKNLDFAARTGMSRAYLWGAEWWYWLETKGETAVPDFVKTLNK